MALTKNKVETPRVDTSKQPFVHPVNVKYDTAISYPLIVICFMYGEWGLRDLALPRFH